MCHSVYLREAFNLMESTLGTRFTFIPDHAAIRTVIFSRIYEYLHLNPPSGCTTCASIQHFHQSPATAYQVVSFHDYSLWMKLSCVEAY